mmetsp:Transcript_1889/g.2715  ORF Transcript_1889/g.2715 Transcript_1889/m.2715 type:complete len:162 (+) Transcript_1889:60-545(+)
MGILGRIIKKKERKNQSRNIKHEGDTMRQLDEKKEKDPMRQLKEKKQRIERMTESIKGLKEVYKEELLIELDRAEDYYLHLRDELQMIGEEIEFDILDPIKELRPLPRLNDDIYQFTISDLQLLDELKAEFQDRADPQLVLGKSQKKKNIKQMFKILIIIF